MELNYKLINILIQSAIDNAYNCFKNTRELNRTTSMGESSRHISKYSHALIEDKMGLMEDLKLFHIISIDKLDLISKIKVDHLYKEFEDTNTSITAYTQIIHTLKKMKLYK